MKKILFTIICVCALVSSCSVEKREEIKQGINVEGDYVLPRINYSDISLLEQDMMYFSNNLRTSNNDGVYTIQVYVDNTDKCPFTVFTYEYYEDGQEGFKFTYSYDEDKQISSAAKKMINETYSQEENMFQVGKITNKI